uniref:14-3-3 domain-containing protein n=1 Tax=Brassica oleracea var. oleracea TaxID=109376 RepID=A0A0D3EGG0_BRAOL
MAATLGRDQYVYMAKLAEQAERYEEMVQFMEQLVTSAAPSVNYRTKGLGTKAYSDLIHKALK